MGILTSIYTLVLFICLVVGVVKFKKLTNPLKLVLLFVAFGCLTEVTSDISKEFGVRNTMPIGNVYIPISFLILGFFYYFLLRDYINKKIIVGIVFVFLLLCIINLIFIQNILEFPNITAAIGALIIIVFSVIQFSKVMMETKIKKLSAEPVIWINTAFLIYYSANFFFYMLYNINIDFSLDFAISVHRFYGGFNILLYALITIGFLIAKQRVKDKE